MESNKIETNHNLWFRIVAKAATDEAFQENLLTNADQVLDLEKKEIRKEVIKDIINDPAKMEEVFGNVDDAEALEMEEMEERLAAFGYIGW